MSEKYYLTDLKESTIAINTKLVKFDMDFSKSKYTGSETLKEILKDSGIDFGNEVLTEGIFDVPIDKIKAMASKVSQNLNNMEGLQKIQNMFGGLTSKLSISDIKNYSLKLGATKGVEEKKLLTLFDRILRSLSAAVSLTTILTTPLGWLIILIALIKAGDFKTFEKNVDDLLKEIKKGAQYGSGEFDVALEIGSIAYGFFLACLIPPWIQVFVFMPAAALFCFISFIFFVVAFLGQFGKK